MRKLSRTLYLLVGVIMPIFIGALHTYVHFKDLLIPEIEQHLKSKEFVISWETQDLWASWGIISFMMGISFIIIGLLNLYIFSRLTKMEYPPIAPLLILGLYQICVIYVGYTFNQAFQLYGGIAGELFVSISLILALRGRKN